MRIAIIDSGVHAGHPHVGGRVSGFGLQPDGTVDGDYVDRIGHGTAVAAAIREKAPDAELVAIKVFWNTLRTDAATLARAIREAVDLNAAVINLSLGTTEIQHATMFRDALDLVRVRGAFVVAARDDSGQQWLPGILEDVIGVRVDWECPRDRCHVYEIESRFVIAASGYPRDIPGVARERNLKGISFAVANVTGFVARALQTGGAADMRTIVERLKHPTDISAGA